MNSRTSGGQPAARRLTIDRLRVSILREPLPEPVPMAIGGLDARHLMLIEIAVDGVWGVGEAWVNHPSWACQERLLTLRHGVVPLLAGRDISDPAALLSDLGAALLPRAHQAGAPGPVWHLLSGLDLAVWDVLGKIQGRSVASLLNPDRPTDPLVPVYSSGIGPTRVAELCRTAAEQGVRAVKAKVGFGVETDTRTLTTIRATLGGGVTIFADANRAWSASEAEQMAGPLTEVGAAWIEEPLWRDSPADFAALSARTGLGIAAGENLYGESAFAPYLEPGLLSMVQPDPAKSGGLSTAVAVARAAGEAGVQVSPHCYSGAVALAASVQMTAAFDQVALVELDVRPSALRTELLDQPWQVVEGHLAVPTGPGLGITLDPRTQARYQVGAEEFILSAAIP